MISLLMFFCESDKKFYELNTAEGTVKESHFVKIISTGRQYGSGYAMFRVTSEFQVDDKTYYCTAKYREKDGSFGEKTVIVHYKPGNPEKSCYYNENNGWVGLVIVYVVFIILISGFAAYRYKHQLKN